MPCLLGASSACNTSSSFKTLYQIEFNPLSSKNAQSSLCLVAPPIFDRLQTSNANCDYKAYIILNNDSDRGV